VKPVENRTWSTKHRGLFYIHAGKKIDRAAYEWLILQGYKLPTIEQLKTLAGGIVGRANLTDVVETHKSCFFDGPFGFVLDGAKELPFKPMRGQLGFFNVNK